MNRLIDIPTCDLVNELAKREGVREFVCGTPNDMYHLDVCDGADVEHIVDIGPARILVVID